MAHKEKENFGKAPKTPGSRGTLDGLPGRMSSPPGDGSSFTGGSGGGPSPDARRKQALGPNPTGGKGPGRGSKPT